MTADTPARVSDELVEVFNTDPLASVGQPKVLLDAMADLRDSRAITQAQAERLAALEAEVGDLQRRWMSELDRRLEVAVRAGAAESSLAASQAKVDGLATALTSARDAIKSLPADSLGVNWMGNDEVPGGTVSWPIRDELLHGIDRALAALPEAKPAVQSDNLEWWGWA